MMLDPSSGAALAHHSVKQDVLNWRHVNNSNLHRHCCQLLQLQYDDNMPDALQAPRAALSHAKTEHEPP